MKDSIAVSRYRDILATYLAPQWRMVLLLAALLCGNIGLQLYTPQLLRIFIDTALADGPARTLTTVALLFLGVALVNQALGVGIAYVGGRVGWRATNRLRGDLVRHCLRLDLPFHHAHTPGELIERVDGDVGALNEFFSSSVLRLVGSGLLLVGVLVVLAREEWRVGLPLALFALLALAVLNRIRGLAVPQNRAERAASADLFGYLEERLGGIEDLRANGAGAYVLRRFYPAIRAAFLAGRRAAVVGALLLVITRVLIALGIGLALGLGVYLLQRGATTVGTVFLFYQYAQLLRQPLEQITRHLQELQRASAGLLRVQELLATRSNLADGAGPPLPAGRGDGLAVEFDGVSFGYAGDDGDRQLHDLSFRLAPGRVLGLLGRTGSGKTTLARLLLRLYDPTAGRVLLGNADLRDVRLANLRERVGIVTQEVQLFGATLRDNQTLVDTAIPDERLLAVLEELGLGAWCAALPRGLDTPLAPDGLSAGEAQLLAFARVFLRDPGLVILDEASSRLDPATERLIERAVDRLLAGRTAVIIAHRLATVGRADEILILDGGRIVEHGPRDDLASTPTSRFNQLLRHGIEEVLA